MKYNKIKLALLAASLLTSQGAFALDDIVDNTTSVNTTAGDPNDILLGTSNNSYSTAIGRDAVAGSAQAYSSEGTVLENSII